MTKASPDRRLEFATLGYGTRIATKRTMNHPIEMLPFEDHYWSRSTVDRLRQDLHCTTSELSEVLTREESQPYFDALRVRDLIREENREGRSPHTLILGRLEMASFRQFVFRGFGEESGSTMRELFFLGVNVKTSEEVTHLELVSEGETP